SGINIKQTTTIVMHRMEIDKEKIDKFHERLRKGALVKAIKGWKRSNIPYKLIEPDLLIAVDETFNKKQPGIILSAYYEIGQFAIYKITDLLNLLGEKQDYPTFLKQIYRFGIYKGFEEKIENAI